MSIDLRPARLDIDAIAGNDVTLVVTVTDAAGAPVNVTGYTIDAKVYRGGSEVAAFGDSVGGVSSNVITLTLTDAQTLGLAGDTSLDWSLRIIDGSDTRDWLAGRFRPYVVGVGGVPSTGAVALTVGAVWVSVSAIATPSGSFQPLDADLTALAAGNLPANLQTTLDARYTSLATERLSALRLDGTVSNGATTPDNAAFTPATTLDVRAAVALDDWTPAAISMICGQWGASGQFGHRMYISTGGTIVMGLSVDGTSNVNITAATNLVTAAALVPGQLCIVRAVYSNSGTDQVAFYYKLSTAESVGDDIDDGSGWTALGAPVTASVPASIFNSTQALSVGPFAGATASIVGLVLACRWEVDGVLQARPDFRRPHYPTQIDDASRIWTMSGSTWAWASVPMGVQVLTP